MLQKIYDATCVFVRGNDYTYFSLWNISIPIYIKSHQIPEAGVVCRLQIFPSTAFRPIINILSYKMENYCTLQRTLRSVGGMNNDIIFGEAL